MKKLKTEMLKAEIEDREQIFNMSETTNDEAPAFARLRRGRRMSNDEGMMKTILDTGSWMLDARGSFPLPCSGEERGDGEMIFI